MARKFMDRLKRSKAFNLFLALMLTVSTLPVQAFAAESADVQSRMSGTCYVQCVRSEWDGGSLFNLTMPDGQVIQGYCLNPGWPTPVDGNMLSGYGWVAALLVVAAVAGAGYAGKQYLDARKEKDGDADGGES